MLRINIPSNNIYKLSCEDFENYQLPTPPNGVETQVNNNATLLFDSAMEAVYYAEHLEELSYYVSDHTRQKVILKEILRAIHNSEAVKSYFS